MGAITFGNTKNRFHESDVVFAEEIAGRTAMALHNARLYHEAQEPIGSKTNSWALSRMNRARRSMRSSAGRVCCAQVPCAKALNRVRWKPSSEMRAIKRGSLTISSMLAHYRGQIALDATIVELGQVVEAAVQSVLPGATAKGIRLQTQCEPGTLPVFADSSRLQQIIWNLLSNAIKFTPKEGAIDVHVRRDGDEALIRISDNGRGIRSESSRHVFERFRQGDGTLTRNSGGLGLGLSIVRHLVEAHGGTVYAESEGPDMGAAFTVRLPISRPENHYPANPDAGTAQRSSAQTHGPGHSHYR